MKTTLYDYRGQAIAENHMPSSQRTKAMNTIEPDFFFGSAYGSVGMYEIERKPYQYHWMVHACCRAITSNLTQLPRYFVDSANKKIEEHEAYEVLEKPNPFMTFKNLMEATILYTLLPVGSINTNARHMKGGQCFWIPMGKNETDKVDLAAGQIPEMIFPYSDEFVKPWMEDKEWKGWTLRLPTNPNNPINYLPNEIIRIYNFSPYNWLEGISMYSPAMRAIIDDVKSDVWNSKLFDNDGVPSGLLKTDQPLTDATAKEASDRWHQKYGGIGSNRKVAVLGQGLEYQQIAYSKKDMEWVEQKEYMIQEVVAAYGLNKIALGKYEDINFATLQEGHKMLWEDTYIPIDNGIMDQINSQWVRNIDVRNRVKFVSDKSNIRVLKKDYTKNITSAKVMYDMGAPAELAFRVNEIPVTEEDYKKYPWLREKAEPKVNPFDQNQNVDIEEDKEKPASPKKEEKQIKNLDNKIIRFTKDERDKISDSYIERVLDPGEGPFLTKLIRFFSSQRNAMLDKVDEWFAKDHSHTHSEKKDFGVWLGVNPEVFLIDLYSSTNDLIKIYKPQVLEQLKRERARLQEELGKQSLVGWNITDPMIQTYVQKRRQELMNINNTTFDKVKDKVNDAVAEGEGANWTIDQYKKAIKEAISEVGEIRKNQARTIARTETGIISSEARFDAFKQEGIEWQQWVNSQDEKVREDHADGTGDGGSIIKVGDLFDVTQLRHPCDPNGDPSEIINCRCVAIAVESENG